MKRVTNHTFLRTIRRALEDSRSTLWEGLPADVSGEATIKRLRRIAHAKKVTQALAQDAGPLADCLHKVRIILNRSDTPGRIIAALWPVLDAPELKQAIRIAPKNRIAAYSGPIGEVESSAMPCRDLLLAPSVSPRRAA
jgi:hypothetical protein